MATAGGSGTTSAAAGTTDLSADQLRGYLVAWGVKPDRVERRAERLAAVGVTLKGLAAVALQPPDVLLSFLIDQGEEATEGDRFDAYVIMAGATAAAAAAEEEAFTACKQLPPQLLMKAADSGCAPGGAAPLHHHMVSAGSVIEVEVSEPHFAPASSGFSSPTASSPASCSISSSLPHSPSDSASSVSACSSSPSHGSASDAAGRASASSRHAVQIDATLAERQLCGAQSLVLRGTSLTGPGNATRRNVVLRLMCGSGITVTASAQQWDREAQSLRVLQGAGAPYLPSLEGCGVVTAGPPSVIGASALITARLGNPLHAHMRGGIPMDDRYVLLLAACLSAACCTLMAKALFHGDIRPDNITATMDAHMHCSLFHLVDLGASCSAALNNPSFRGKYGYSASHDLSREAIVSDNAFSSLNALEGQPLLPCADLEAAVYTLVFLASGNLPWAPGPECPVAGRQRAMKEAAAWEPLATLPPPVARFAAWVLGNAMRETAPLEELRDHTASLFLAVHQELGLSLPCPAGIPGKP